jgi:hypothetical protein
MSFVRSNSSLKGPEARTRLLGKTVVVVENLTRRCETVGGPLPMIVTSSGRRTFDLPLIQCWQFQPTGMSLTPGTRIGPL